MPLGKVCDFKNGFAFKSSLFKDSGSPILRITNIDGSLVNADSLVFCDPDDYSEDLEAYSAICGDLLIAMSGATTGKIGTLNISNQKFYINQRVGKFLPHRQSLNNRYLYHWLATKTDYLYAIAGGGAQPNLSSRKLMEMAIPVPPLEEQERIVAILDRFDSFANDISQGLPAEIEARKKQYEHYRDKLLTFKEKAA